MTREERIAGCMFGAAAGDALGAAFEFVDAAAIERHLGSAFAWDFVPAVRGSLLYPRAPGQPTDDTAMALSVASAIASDEPLTAQIFARRFLADLERRKGQFATMFWGGGPGGATTRALARLRNGADPTTCGHRDDGGNGAAMRAHPVGFLHDRAQVLEVAALQARVTHGHPAAIAAAQAVAVLVHDALVGTAPGIDVPAGIDDPMFVAAWKRAHADLRADERLPAHLRNVAMSGWETVASAHAIATLYADDPRRAIAAAAASGGDTDTIACITGALVGARSGLGALPSRWVEGITYRNEIETASGAAIGRAGCHRAPALLLSPPELLTRNENALSRRR